MALLFLRGRFTGLLLKARADRSSRFCAGARRGRRLAPCWDPFREPPAGRPSPHGDGPRPPLRSRAAAPVGRVSPESPTAARRRPARSFRRCEPTTRPAASAERPGGPPDQFDAVHAGHRQVGDDHGIVGLGDREQGRLGCFDDVDVERGLGLASIDRAQQRVVFDEQNAAIHGSAILHVPDTGNRRTAARRLVAACGLSVGQRCNRSGAGGSPELPVLNRGRLWARPPVGLPPSVEGGRPRSKLRQNPSFFGRLGKFLIAGPGGGPWGPVRLSGLHRRNRPVILISPLFGTGPRG